MKCGIIGLPNVGKSTLFNALCENEQALAANYPFATIDPNSSLVKVPDERLDQIANICNPQKIIPAAFEIVDIAGLVKGASKGEGLGNAFLSHIRSVNALFHIVRCFEDDDIQHVENRIDPLSDIQIINAELALSDLDILEKNHQKLKKIQKTDDDKKKVSIIEKSIQLISDEKKILGNLDKEEINYLNTYQLISTKPVVYICNVDENSALSGNEFTKKIDTYAKENNSEVLLISAKIESEISQITDFKDKQDFLESMGLKETGLKRVIKKEKLLPEVANKVLKRVGSACINEKKSIENLVKRPNITLKELLKEFKASKKYDDEVIDQVDIGLKYESYIKKEKEVVEKMKRLEQSTIPLTFDYQKVSSLSAEGKEKLIKIKPKSIGQASRISGVSPSDVSILMVHLKK